MEYEGKQYVHSNGKWYYNNLELPIPLQSKLNEEYNKKIINSNINNTQLIKIADGYKKSRSYSMAIETYERVLLQNKNLEEIKYILPRITSCYRANNQPQKAIDLYCDNYNKYGKLIDSGPFSTSIAAAYCDIAEYANAKKSANKAYALLAGQASDELRAVYGRINKNT